MEHPELVQWQRLNENGLVECWFTHDSLDWINKQDWSDKIAVMFGAGLGDAWLAGKCKKLYVVERKEEWLSKAQEYSKQCGATNIEYIFRPCNDCSGMDEMYCDIPFEVDIVIIDDAYRYECMVKALTLPRPLILIVDNFNQDWIFDCPAAVELMEPYNPDIYPQRDHEDHAGKCWKTLVAHIQ